jgi:hypothetical protein
VPDDDIITQRRLTLQQAMSLTEHALRLRLKCYRNLVICVLVAAFLTLLWTAIQSSWLPLFGFLLFVPLTGAFLCVDSLLVHRWRQKLLQMWVDEQMDVDIFCETLCIIRVLPEQTLQGMLSTLPTQKKLQISEDVDPLVRMPLAETLQAINACESDRTLLASISITAGLASVALAAVLLSWLPLLGLLLVIPFFGLGAGINRLRLWCWKRKVLALLQEEPQLKNFVELAARLDWQPIAAKRKTRLLGDLMDRARATL